MSLTLAQLRTRIRNEMQETDTDVFTTAFILQLINECLDDVSYLKTVNNVLRERGQATSPMPFESSQDYTIVAATHNYDVWGDDSETYTKLTLPTDYASNSSDKGMIIQDSNANPCVKVNLASMDMILRSNSNANVFYMYQDTIILPKESTVGEIIRLFYNKRLTHLAAEDSTLDSMLDNWDEIITYYVRYRVAMIDEDFTLANYYKYEFFVPNCMSFAAAITDKKQGKMEWKTWDRQAYWNRLSSTESNTQVTIGAETTVVVVDGGWVT